MSEMTKMTKERALEIFAEITGGAPTKDLAGAVRAKIFRGALVQAYDAREIASKSIDLLRREAIMLTDGNVEGLKEVAGRLDSASAENAVAEARYAKLRLVWDTLDLSPLLRF